jgi:hypothetical protein
MGGLGTRRVKTHPFRSSSCCIAVIALASGIASPTTAPPLPGNLAGTPWRCAISTMRRLAAPRACASKQASRAEGLCTIARAARVMRAGCAGCDRRGAYAVAIQLAPQGKVGVHQLAKAGIVAGEDGGARVACQVGEAAHARHHRCVALIEARPHRRVDLSGVARIGKVGEPERRQELKR